MGGAGQSVLVDDYSHNLPALTVRPEFDRISRYCTILASNVLVEATLIDGLGRARANPIRIAVNGITFGIQLYDQNEST
jgi:hypothetical protein